MARKLSVAIRKWPLRKPFVISRGSRTETSTVTVTITDGPFQGVGEGVANPRYSETSQSVAAGINAAEHEIKKGVDRDSLQKLMPAGAARNAVDCALWDLEAKQSGKNVGALSGLGWPENVRTVQTISILSPEKNGSGSRQPCGLSCHQGKTGF